jgi:hypothetical protein
MEGGTMMRATRYSIVCLIAIFSAIALSTPMEAVGQHPAKPRLLVLPWVVIDRSSNQDCAKLTPQPPVSAEARRLAVSAQETLDAAMHRHRMMGMIPRRDWEPHWKQLPPGKVFSQGPGCAICTPIGSLLRYDHAALRQLGQAVQADYVWLGVSVVPLISGQTPARPDDCCREALGRERDAVLARSSVLLVRIQDGEVVWQRDARRFDAEVPRRVGRAPMPARFRREIAVKGTAKMLGNAFRREHRGWAG